MHLLRSDASINLDYIQFIHEEREDLILHFGEGTNLRTTSVARNSLKVNCCSGSWSTISGRIRLRPSRHQVFRTCPCVVQLIRSLPVCGSRCCGGCVGLDGMRGLSMRSVDLGLVAVRQFPEQPVSRPVSQSRFLANHV